MKILLLWPKFPATFWSFKSALPFIAKKAALPPLGLLTVASLLPQDWEKKLIDLNIENLKDKDILWADFVFISAMAIQKDSVMELIDAAKKFDKKIAAGGPLFTTDYEDFSENIDHFILDEGEETLPLFLADIKRGELKKVYRSSLRPDIKKTPRPSWELIKLKNYALMCVQYSRGCPFNCEFCDIVFLNGRVPRTKNKEQILAELDALYEQGWREGVFFVDDNFIGNKAELKKEVLPAIIHWQKERHFPFSFNTQASINLSDDEELMDLMLKAGFETVFIGIETVEEESLQECQKLQNVNRDLLSSIKLIQNRGFQIQGGFILGFDNDTPSIFNRMIDFIQKSKITMAMVGLLQALPETRLWQRLKEEKRLLSRASGDTYQGALNFIPKMNRTSLLAGYKKVVDHIYAPKQYYQRLIAYLKEYKPKKHKKYKMNFSQSVALLKSFWVLGIKEKERSYFWKLLFWCLFRKPKTLPMAVRLAILGFHFRKVAER
ncbi:MAG: Radical SAM domain protein [Parcubacteria group bacterium GW2011_GWF2_43_11]|nr:MAG: Radical SAM domain protein [Parcubacteria group bacterium GW2011_GWF2_43_11]